MYLSIKVKLQKVNSSFHQDYQQITKEKIISIFAFDNFCVCE